MKENKHACNYSLSLHRTLNKILLLFFFSYTIAIYIGCETAVVETQVDEKDIQILNPKAGKDYSYVHSSPIEVIYRYNPKTIKIPVHFLFSRDEKTTWDTITADYRTIRRKIGDDFLYATFKWTPQKDSLHNINIYIKASGANPAPNDDIDTIGPVKID